MNYQVVDTYIIALISISYSLRNGDKILKQYVYV